MKRLFPFLLILALFYSLAFGLGESPISGSGTTNASDLSSGLVATARGGTNKDSSGSTGTPYVLSGTWTFDNAATALGRLGISAVENTALSTWAGTTNVTTLGTIGTGTWNADIISKAMGGFGASIASQTGIPTWATGAITWNSWAAFLLQAGVIYNPADNTWIFPAAITATEYVSSALDNTRGATIPNTADPTTTNLALGKGWFNITSNMLKWRNGDNTATLEVFTSGAAHTLNFATTGTLTSGINVVALTDNTTLSGAQVYGSLIEAGAGADNVTLPAKIQGMSVCVMAMDNVQKRIIPNGSDAIVYEGLSAANGEAFLSTAATATAPNGEYLCLVGSAVANKWRAMGRGKTAWTEATP